MKIIIVIVNYNSINAVKRMLNSANELNIKPVIYVLDNNSSRMEQDINFDPQHYYDGQSYFVRLPDNYGYFGAISVFLSSMNKSSFDWLFIANSDLFFDDSCLFDYLSGFSMDDVGVYCPSVISNRTKLDQNPFLWSKPGKYYYYKYKLVTSNYYLAKAYTTLGGVKSKIRRCISSQNRIIKKPQEIFAPHGAFVGISRKFFEQGGYIENRNFLFHEEEILGFICDRINLKVIYDPQVKILHDEHVVIGTEYSREKHIIKKKSLSILKEYMITLQKV